MTFKVYEAVNANLLGLNKNERTTGDYQLHPLIRDDWRSVDKYRDLQGNVPAFTTNQDGDLIVDERVAVGGSSFFRPFIGSDSVYTQIAGSSDSDTITIELRAENYLTDWNEGNINNIPDLNNLLEQNNPGGDFAGIPYFEKFFHVNSPNLSEPYGLLTTDPRMAGATRNIKPIMQQDWTRGKSAALPIFNHKFNYRFYDRTMSGSSYNIEVESTYNLYLDTDPDYESVISDVSEALIPNFYHIEISISTAENNGSVIPAYNMFDNTQINNTDYVNVLLGSLSSSNIAENDSTSQGFLQFYCNNINNLSPNYKTYFGNVAVLSHDVADGILNVINGTIRDDRGTSTEQDDFYAIETYPFYNKITIPYINQWAGNAIIEELDNALGLDWAQYFITLLELLIIKEYKLTEDGSSTPDDSLPFVIYDTNDGNKVVSQSQNVDLAIRVEDVLNALINLDPNDSLYQDIDFIFSDGIDYLTGEGSPRSGASFIQNYGDPNVADSFFNGFSQWYSDLDSTQLSSALEAFAAFRNGTTGEFQRIYQSRGGSNNESNHSDTPIMYMVEKRVIPVGQLSADPNDSSTVVQRFFFGRDITTGQKGITYYDTQIKYGVRYQYDIKQIRLVVGERYYYHNHASITNSGSVHQGRAIGNALGFYAEESIDITSTQTFQIANNLEGFSYLPENEETPFIPVTGAHQGYYVYKIPVLAEIGSTVANINDIFGSGQVGDYPPGELAFAKSRNPNSASDNIDLNLLLIRIRGGDGFDGNFDGGAIGVAATGSIPSAPFPPGVDETLLLEEEIDQELEEEEIEEGFIDQMTGQAAQTAQQQATSAMDAVIASQMSSGQIQTGGVSVNIRTGQVNIPGLTNLPGNPGGPSASGGFGGNIPNISNLSPNPPDPLSSNVTSLPPGAGLQQDVLQNAGNNTQQSVDQGITSNIQNLINNLRNNGYLG